MSGTCERPLGIRTELPRFLLGPHRNWRKIQGKIVAQNFDSIKHGCSLRQG